VSPNKTHESVIVGTDKYKCSIGHPRTLSPSKKVMSMTGRSNTRPAARFHTRFNPITGARETIPLPSSSSASPRTRPNNEVRPFVSRRDYDDGHNIATSTDCRRAGGTSGPPPVGSDARFDQKFLELLRRHDLSHLADDRQHRALANDDDDGCCRHPGIRKGGSFESDVTEEINRIVSESRQSSSSSSPPVLFEGRQRREDGRDDFAGALWNVGSVARNERSNGGDDAPGRFDEGGYDARLRGPSLEYGVSSSLRGSIDEDAWRKRTVVRGESDVLRPSARSEKKCGYERERSRCDDDATSSGGAAAEPSFPERSHRRSVDDVTDTEYVSSNERNVARRQQRLLYGEQLRKQMEEDSRRRRDSEDRKNGNGRFNERSVTTRGPSPSMRRSDVPEEDNGRRIVGRVDAKAKYREQLDEQIKEKERRRRVGIDAESRPLSQYKISNVSRTDHRDSSNAQPTAAIGAKAMYRKQLDEQIREKERQRCSNKELCETPQLRNANHNNKPEKLINNTGDTTISLREEQRQKKALYAQQLREQMAEKQKRETVQKKQRDEYEAEFFTTHSPNGLLPNSSREFDEQRRRHTASNENDRAPSSPRRVEDNDDDRKKNQQRQHSPPTTYQPDHEKRDPAITEPTIFAPIITTTTTPVVVSSEEQNKRHLGHGSDEQHIRAKREKRAMALRQRQYLEEQIREKKERKEREKREEEERFRHWDEGERRCTGNGGGSTSSATDDLDESRQKTVTTTTTSVTEERVTLAATVCAPEVNTEVTITEAELEAPNTTPSQTIDENGRDEDVAANNDPTPSSSSSIDLPSPKELDDATAASSDNAPSSSPNAISSSVLTPVSVNDCRRREDKNCRDTSRSLSRGGRLEEPSSTRRSAQRNDDEELSLVDPPLAATTERERHSPTTTTATLWQKNDCGEICHGGDDDSTYYHYYEDNSSITGVDVLPAESTLLYVDANDETTTTTTMTEFAAAAAVRQ